MQLHKKHYAELARILGLHRASPSLVEDIVTWARQGNVVFSYDKFNAAVKKAHTNVTPE